MRHLPLIPLFAAACGIDDEAFRKALPQEKTVTIQAPDGGSTALTMADATLGQRAELYNTTRAFTREVNGGVRGLVLLIRQIAAQPPTTRDGDTRIWGPGADALDPVIYRFKAVQESEGVFSYALQYRPRGSDDEEANYVSLISGNADVSSGVNDGVGDMKVEIDNWTEVEPGACGSGTLDIDYDTREEPQFLSVGFTNFSDRCETAGEHRPLAAATYYYARFADGSGNFQFTATGDIDEGAADPDVNETLAIRSRWLADGSGRSDVRIHGGDMQTRHGIAEATGNECWDDMFNLTYADTTPSIIDPSHADLGQESSCPEGLRQAEYAADI